MRIRRVIALSLVAILSISMLGGCAKNGDNTSGTKGAEDAQSAMGRYLGEEIALPEGVKRILDIQLMNDGNISGIMGTDEGGMSVWTTLDYGKTWDEQYALSVEDMETEFIYEATMCKDGSVIYILFKMAGNNGSEEYWKIAENSEKTKIDIVLPEVKEMGMPNSVSGFSFSAGEETSGDVGADAVVSRQFVVGADGDVQIVGDDETGDEQGVISEAGDEQGAISETDDEQGVISESGGEQEAISETGVQSEADASAVVGAESSIVFNGMGSQDGIRKFRVGDNDEAIIETTMNKVYRVDLTTGAILKSYPIAEDQYITGTSIVAGKVYIETGSGLNCYDLETGDSVPVGEALANQVANNNSGDRNYMYMDQGGLSITSKEGDTSGSLYLADSTGVYRQGEDGTVLELIIDASLTALSMPNTAVSRLFALKDDSFLVYVVSDEYGGNNLYRYVYSNEVRTTPESEIKVYSLEDNAEIRQALALYQKANPDVMVTLQVGMTGEEGITVSDALNTLNTEIMAGKGPDLLVLDGMPIDSYVEKGILADISDVVDKIDEESGILATVKDNHAIASRFSVPYLQGEAKYIDAITSIATLNTAAKAAKEDKPGKKGINFYNMDEMMKYLYKIYVNNFITAAGKLDKVSLQNFMEQAKEIIENSQGKKVEVNSPLEDISTETITYGASFDGDAMTSAIDLLFGESIIGRGQIRTQNDLAVIIALKEKMDWKHKLLTDDAGENLIMTNTILGINSKGEHIEETKKLLNYCLSREAQMSSQKMGLPVNKAALSETLNQDFEQIGFAATGITDDGVETMTELTVIKPSDEEIKAFEDSVLDITKIGYSDRIVEDIVMEQLVSFVEERTTLNEAVEAIDKKVSLYLAE